MIQGKISLVCKVLDEVVVINDYYGRKARQGIIERWQNRYGFEKYYLHIEPDFNLDAITPLGRNKVVRQMADRKTPVPIARPKAEYSNRNPWSILESNSY